VISKVIRLLLLACIGLPSATWGAGEWFMSLYGGKFSDNALLDILRLEARFESSYIYVLSVGKEMGRHNDRISYELESQIATHRGRQFHEEINGALTLRWLPFPWDRH
jgi:hypothetical protein